MRAVRPLLPCLLVASLLALAACAARAPRPRAVPLEGEGLLLVYLERAPAEAARLSFTLEGLGAVGLAGEVALAPRLTRLDLATLRGQRLLATTRLAPGAYEGLSLRLGQGSLVGADGKPSALVSPEGPVAAGGTFTITAGSATVLSLSVNAPAGGEVFKLAPSFTLTPAERPILSFVALATGPALLTHLDRRTLRVGAAEAALRGPEGVAIDPRRGLGFVVESGLDRVAMLDLASGERLGEILLRPGDRPGAIDLAPDGRLAVVVNRGPESVSFLDTQLGLEVARAAVAQDPRSVRVDRQGRFAYVVSRASNTVTVLDLATREAVGTLATDPLPVGVALGRSGDRLYVAHAGSAYLSSFVLPDRTPAERIFVGLGATAVHVDANTGLIALALGDERVVRFYAPGQQTPAGQVEVPGAVTRLLVDDVEQALVALVPETANVVAIDLATRRVKAVAELPEQPGDLAIAGERR